MAREKTGYADAGYLGVEKREEIATRSPGVEWHVAAKRGKIKARAEGVSKELTRATGEAQSPSARAGGTSLSHP